jgi:hypothetical protein
MSSRPPRGHRGIGTATTVLLIVILLILAALAIYFGAIR